jgi:hypothetical protein
MNSVNEHDRFEPLESLIRDARWYVVPSEDLRPKTVEAALDRFGDPALRHRVLQWAACFLFLCTCTVLILNGLTPVGSSENSLSNEQLYSRAAYYAQMSGESMEWGLVEAMSEVRRQQAKSFRGQNDSE